MIGSIVSTKRYWKQIAELRADRLSIQICDKEKEPFIEYWNDRDRNHKIEKNSFIVRYYRKYIKNEAHPSMKRRMGLLKNRNRWYIWDYIEHAMVIRVWRITNRGWNGYKQV